MKRHDDGENHIDDDNGKTQEQAQDVRDSVGNDEVENNRGYGEPDAVFEQDGRFRSIHQALKGVAEVLVKPVEIDNADQAAQQNPQGKAEGLKDSAGKEKKT